MGFLSLGLCESIDRDHVAIAQEGTALTQPMAVYGVFPSFTLPLQGAEGLAPGQAYRLCVDLDGLGVEYSAGDSGILIHISPVEIVGAEPVMLQQGTGQILQLLCHNGASTAVCNPASTAFLALTPDIRHPGLTQIPCDAVSNPGHPGQSRTIDTTFVPHGPGIDHGAVYSGYGSQQWNIILDTTLLAAGSYRLCVDLDGYGTLFQPGDVGANVVVQGQDPFPHTATYGS